MICTFFGHSRFDKSYIPKLKEVIEDLITNHSADKFYVGNHGGFDGAVEKVLDELACKYPYIKYYVVLAYMPREVEKEGYHRDFSNTILPDGFEKVPPKAAIIHRNNWMLEKSDCVVAYITHTALSGAAQFAERAKKKGKRYINIAD